MDAPWVWRKASGGFTTPFDIHDGRVVRIFHACDVNANLACTPWSGLAATSEEPNEGSTFCAECRIVVQAEPGGRELKVYS